MSPRLPDRRHPPRVLILGTGALAKLVGARLARTGAAGVTLAGTWRAAVDAMAARGITVEETDGAVWTVPVRTVSIEPADARKDGSRAQPSSPACGGGQPCGASREAGGGDLDLVFVLVKSHQTARVAPIAAQAVDPAGIVVTLQNGLGNRDELVAAGIPSDRVVVGVTSAGASGLGPDRVKAGGPGWTTLGATAANRDRVDAVAALLGAAGFDADVADDIERLVWRKLAVNCAINPLSALLRVPNGRLLDDAGARATMAAAAREVGAVAEALGIDLGADPVELAVDVARRTAGNRSSMLQDVERGAPTEIDAISGAVVRAGRSVGVPTPVNAELWRGVREGNGCCDRETIEVAVRPVALMEA